MLRGKLPLSASLETSYSHSVVYEFCTGPLKPAQQC